jgi:hypothetical protein
MFGEEARAYEGNWARETFPQDDNEAEVSLELESHRLDLFVFILGLGMHRDITSCGGLGQQAARKSSYDDSGSSRKKGAHAPKAPPTSKSTPSSTILRCSVLQRGANFRVADNTPGMYRSGSSLLRAARRTTNIRLALRSTTAAIDLPSESHLSFPSVAILSHRPRRQPPSGIYG